MIRGQNHLPFTINKRVFMNIYDIAEVDFYGDVITVIMTDNTEPYVVISQLLGNLGLNITDYEDSLFKDPRIPMEVVEGQPVCTLDVLNGLLYLIRSEEVNPVFREDLLKYQLECTKALRDYWLKGVSINLRSTPYKVGSDLRDERMVSRPILRDAIKEYCTYNEGVDPHQLYDRALSTCYKIIGVDPKAEDEALGGATAKYLSWLETIYAKVVKHCIRWAKHPADLDLYAKEHVLSHVSEIGKQWLQFGETVPSSMYK